MTKKIWMAVLLIAMTANFAHAQQAEVLIQLNEQFFDALLAAIFRDAKTLEFPLAAYDSATPREKSTFGFAAAPTDFCSETVRLLREVDGVKTSVRFRDGQIFAPIAFAGNYNPPLVGCVEFSGVADTIINLEFDKNSQTLIGRAKVQNVNLSGTGGIGGSLIARVVQSSIDKKINPINILQTEKVSFAVPVQNVGTVRMKAVGMRHEIVDGALNVRIQYQF